MDLQLLAHKIKRRRTETFLYELVNLNVIDAEDVQRFIRRFRELAPTRGGRGVEPDEGEVFVQHGALRAAWKQPTTLGREVAILGLIWKYWSKSQEWPDFQPQPDGYALALLYALHVAARLRLCANQDCSAKFFVARRSSQKYCGEDCAAPALRAAKLEWWQSNRAKAKWNAEKPPKRKGGKRP